MNKRQLYRHIIIRPAVAALCVAAAAGIVGCGGASEAERDLRNAEMAVAEGDMDVATSVANHINGLNENTPALSATQLARLSIVYMQLADYADEDTNTAMAVNYCRAALKENADSAEAYYSQLEPDQVGYGRTLMMLVQHLDAPEGADSLLNEPDHDPINESAERHDAK